MQKQNHIGYVAIDQYGTTHHLTDPTRHPRKQLLDILCATHADKIYVDGPDGESEHIGYVIAGGWYRIHEVHSWAGRG